MKKQELNNGFIVVVEDYKDGNRVCCYFSDWRLFEEIICPPEFVKGYIKQWESLV